MRLYTESQLSDIRRHLLAGEKRFSMGAYRCYFADTPKEYTIQRIPNFALGLAYVPGEDAFALNYPHIDNVRKDALPAVSNAWIQEKTNGTNLGIVRAGRRVIHRTRGTLEPEKVINDINSAVLQGKNTIVGVQERVFERFRARYEPILSEGIERGYVDDFGNFNIGRVAKEASSAFGPSFDSMPSLMGVFMEACSKFNPICVNESVNVGIYLDIPEPFMLVVFDVISREGDGSMTFWGADTLDQFVVNQKNILVAKGSRLSLDLLDSGLRETREEGFVVKSPNGYWKFKRADVLAWERTVGHLPNILSYSVSHIFEQQFSFHESEILAGALKRPTLKEEVVAAAWSEAENNGVSRKQLLEFYAKGRSAVGADAEARLDRMLEDMIARKLLLFAAPALRNKGVQKSELWRELPNYVAFEREPLYFDAKKGRQRAEGWYSRLVSGVIGRTYF